MTSPPTTSEAASAGRPRVWPGVVAVLAYWVAVGVTRWVAPGTMVEFFVCLRGPVAAAVAVGIWWGALSRFPRRTRLGVLALAGVVGAVAVVLADRSMSHLVLTVFALPWVVTAFVAGAVVAARVAPRVQWRLMGAVVIACGLGVCAARLEGVTSELSARMGWRWAATKEEEFLAAQSQHAASSDVEGDASVDSEPLVAGDGDWTGFRGPRRDGVLRGVMIETDWSAHPPEQLWRRPIGPGWSSFAVIGERIFTLDQRGAEEFVSCSDAATGRELWSRGETARFDEAVSGPGPRSTPTFHDGRIYTFGGSGRLRCLDARSGRAVWSRDVAAETGAALPQYGFASSPLVADGLVSVFAGGPGGKSVAAYRAETGEPAWFAGEGTVGYSSVQREEFDGVPQYLCTSDTGVTAFDPATGRTLWSNAWPIEKQNRIVQPCRLEGNRLLIGTGLNFGIRLLEVVRDGDGWRANEVWTDNTFKPYFNDIVIHGGCAYGYDGSLLSGFDLGKQKRLWKKRGYDSGQLLLLEPQGVLVIAAENGTVSLMTADPTKPRELGRIAAFTGKSWSHPVIAHGRLFLRNSEEMACYQLDEVRAPERSAGVETP